MDGLVSVFLVCDFNAKRKEGFMKRRKIVGLTLFIATIVYVTASFLALYQNQRVELEKSMSEKADISDLDEQRLSYEDSFAKVEKSVSNVTNEISSVENSVSHLTDTIANLQNHTINSTDKVTNLQNQINTIKNQTLVIENLQNEIVQYRELMTGMGQEIENISEKIMMLENTIAEKNSSQDENMELLQNSLMQWEEKMKELEENILFYSFDEEAQTLKVYGNK